MKRPKLPRGLTYRGQNTIVATFNVNGLPVRRAVGTLGVNSITECEAARLEFKKQAERGTYTTPEPHKAPVKEVTCSDLWDAYKQDCGFREVKRMDRLELAWSHLEPCFGARPAADIKPRDIADYVAKRRADGMANATCNRELAILKAAFHVGARLEMVAALPAFPKRLKEAKARKGFTTESEYRTLAGNCSDLWLRTFLALGFSFGCRKTEMLNLRVRDVDLLGGWLTIAESKNGESREIPLTQETSALLAESISGKQGDDFVLTHADGTRVAQPRKDWYSLCARCGLGKLDVTGQGREKRMHYEGLQMHDLRRSAVSRNVDLGMPEKTAMAISGHKTRSVFDRYKITTKRNLKDAAKLLDASKTVTETVTSAFVESPDYRKSLN